MHCSNLKTLNSPVWLFRVQLKPWSPLSPLMCICSQALTWLHSPLLQSPKQNTEVQLHSCPRLNFSEIRRQQIFTHPEWFAQDWDLCEQHIQELNKNPSCIPLVPSSLHDHSSHDPSLPGNRDGKWLPACIVMEVRHLEQLVAPPSSVIQHGGPSGNTDSGKKHKLRLLHLSSLLSASKPTQWSGLFLSLLSLKSVPHLLNSLKTPLFFFIHFPAPHGLYRFSYSFKVFPQNWKWAIWSEMANCFICVVLPQNLEVECSICRENSFLTTNSNVIMSPTTQNEISWHFSVHEKEQTLCLWPSHV